MATVTPIEPGWPARTFVDYEMVPALLAACLDAPPGRPPEAWAPLLDDGPAHTEHLDDEEDPIAEDDLADTLRADAWQMLGLLGLLNDDGLTSEGMALSTLASHAPYDRDNAWHETLCDTLAWQLKTHHLGAGNLGLAGLLVRGAGLLAATEHVWAAYCPGLLLVEFIALVQAGRQDADAAADLCERLVRHRDSAMARHGMPSPDRPPMENMVIHCDAVTDWYYDNVSLLEDGPTLGTVRASIMLYTFAGLLGETSLLGPVHCLRPGRE